MTLSITLDWLALTYKENTRELQTFCNLYARAPSLRDATPRNGYNSASVSGDGVVCMWHSDREEMGYHVIFAGSALRNLLQRTGISQRDLVKEAVLSGGHITRLDLAKDAQNVPINLSAIWDDIEAKKNTGAARTFSTIVSQDGARTIYIGSRTSERFARIYDKLAQMGIRGGEWKRYELETKGMVARALAHLLVREADWGSAFDTMALAMLDLPGSVDFTQFFAPGQVHVGIPKIERTSNRELWIQTQVIKAVVEHYLEFPDSPAVLMLWETLKFNRSQKGQST